jgi:hypothetical protein
MKVYTRKLQSTMWAMGMPTDPSNARRYADIMRAAMKAGLTESQAFALVTLAFNAANHYVWNLPTCADSLEYHTKRNHAALYPNGKYAAELQGKPYP